MFTKQIIIAIIITLTISADASAQGEFLEREQSGFSILPLFTFGENSSGYGVSMGYCANGYLDFGFTYAKDDDIDAKGYGPTVTAHLIKKHTGNGMFGASGYLGFERVEIPIVDTTSFKTTLIHVAAGVYHNFYLSDWLTIQPSFVSSATIDLETSWEQSSGGEADKLDFYQNLGLAMELCHDKQYRPFLMLGLTIPNQTSEDVSGSVGAGLLVAF